ncbi:hypothetical protein [Helcococcus kunzii]|uniref:hypothetical protein n=1 Tax=Helcococcus kunzii TaxID=40091 RepID=UPI001BB02AF8|nr:hypothetical protein [Helcococcus kunzii]MCT1795558.1 hypothetical protein [Helcococcus kunzii]MCT1989334.1 hypothetical protein [Helcococcus kunzii]QUY64801.1 hypothetical protein GUI37_04455 [Helcococcus kunzii]
MKKILNFALFIIVLITVVSCNKNTTSNDKTKDEDTVKKETEELTKETNNEEVTKSLFADGELKNISYSNTQAKLEYIGSDKFNLKIRIEQKDEIKFTTENQNIYADIYISSQEFENEEILNVKDINDKSLYKIPLKDGKIPATTEILIDEKSELLTPEEKNGILNKTEGLWISVQLRDPQGQILEVSNTIFNEKN